MTKIDEEIKNKFFDDICKKHNKPELHFDGLMAFPLSGNIYINETYKYISLDEFLVKYNKKIKYENFLKKFNATVVKSIKKFMNYFYSNDRELFAKFLFSVKDYKNVRTTLNIISKLRNNKFIKKLEKFKPSTMYGKGEFLILFLVETSQRTPDDILLGGKSFNVKYTNNVNDAIRTGVDGLHSNFNFKNNCIDVLIKSICNNNSDGNITKNYNAISNDDIEHFQYRNKQNVYKSEFNKSDYMRILKIINLIELRGYDVTYLKEDIQTQVDSLTKNKIIQFTKNEIILNGTYKLSHITQGRLRPVLDDSYSKPKVLKPKVLKPKVLKPKVLKPKMKK